MSRWSCCGVVMSFAAAKNVAETATDVEKDLRDLRAGKTRDALLEECLNGAEEDRVAGWRDYVSAVAQAAFEGEEQP